MIVSNTTKNTLAAVGLLTGLALTGYGVYSTFTSEEANTMQDIANSASQMACGMFSQFTDFFCSSSKMLTGPSEPGSAVTSSTEIASLVKDTISGITSRSGITSNLVENTPSIISWITPSKTMITDLASTFAEFTSSMTSTLTKIATATPIPGITIDFSLPTCPVTDDFTTTDTLGGSSVRDPSSDAIVNLAVIKEIAGSCLSNVWNVTGSVSYAVGKCVTQLITG